jgi:hypothetical protein
MEVTEQLIKAADDSTDINSLVSLYVQLRDAKEEIKRLMTEKQKPIIDLMDSLETKMLGLLDASGMDSAKTSSGTVYRTPKTNAKVADWNVLIAYVVANEAYDLLTKSVAKDAVKSRIEETGEIVPGVDMYTFNTVGVRRS